MFYVISSENGDVKTGYFNSYNYCLDYALSCNFDCDFTIEEYYSEDDYFSNL